MGQNTRKPVIDFARHMSERTDHFTGREGVFQAINDWLVNPAGSRYFLLTGAPGSGKTAIASRLVQFSQGIVAPVSPLAALGPHFLSALHFCSARDNRWITPSVFAESLAIQLAERYQPYAKALAEKSGDRQIHIEVQQRIEQGHAVGIVIKQLHVSGGPPEEIFSRLVREPLEALLQEEFGKQIVILVDGLDEALAYPGNTNIVSLLSHMQKLPPTARFLLTSRNDGGIVRVFQDTEEFMLSSVRYKQQNQEDIHQYVKERLATDTTLAKNAAELDAGALSEKVVETIVQKADGNFLTARYLLDALAGGKRSLTGVEELLMSMQTPHPASYQDSQEMKGLLSPLSQPSGIISPRVVEHLALQDLSSRSESPPTIPTGGFPQHWMVPYRHNPYFLAPKQALARLHRGFRGTGPSLPAPVQAITGLGGMGKTQLATEYAFHYRNAYPGGVFWVRADSPAALLADFLALAEQVEMPLSDTSRREPDQMINAITSWFRTHGEWLLILDNADNLAQVRPFLPAAYQGHILLTTRAVATGDIAQGVGLSKLKVEDGARFLLARAKLVHKGIEASMIR